MSATGSTHIGRSGVPRRRPQRVAGSRATTFEPVLKYTPSEHGWQDVFWQGERIGMVKRKDRGIAPWYATTASGMSPGFFGTRRAAGAHLRRLIEGRRSA